MAIAIGFIPTNKSDIGSIKYYICDLESELPSAHEADFAYTKDTDTFWVASESGWVSNNGGGGGSGDGSIIAVNSTVINDANFNDTAPPTLSGGVNVKWRQDGTNISAYVPISSLPDSDVVDSDYVVITKTNDSNNPKRTLVSNISISNVYNPVTDPFLLLLI